jgi:HEAT repeat protein
VSALVERLASADPHERVAACRALPADPAAALLAESLLPVLDDADARVARAAREALVAVARAGAGDAIVRRLRTAVRGQAVRARAQAALALARLEPPEPALLPALVEGLDAPDSDLRWAAARVLVDMGRLHGEIVRVLIGLARVARPNARRMAVLALRELAPDAAAAAHALVDASRDADAPVRRAALTAMAGLVDPPPAVRARLAEAVHEPDPIAARLAALALEKLGPSSSAESR